MARGGQTRTEVIGPVFGIGVLLVEVGVGSKRGHVWRACNASHFWKPCPDAVRGEKMVERARSGFLCSKSPACGGQDRRLHSESWLSAGLHSAKSVGLLLWRPLCVGRDFDLFWLPLRSQDSRFRVCVAFSPPCFRYASGAFRSESLCATLFGLVC